MELARENVVGGLLDLRAAGHEVDNDTALASYLESVLRFRTVERVLLTEE